MPSCPFVGKRSPQIGAGQEVEDRVPDREADHHAYTINADGRADQPRAAVRPDARSGALTRLRRHPARCRYLRLCRSCGVTRFCGWFFGGGFARCGLLHRWLCSRLCCGFLGRSLFRNCLLCRGLFGSRLFGGGLFCGGLGSGFCCRFSLAGFLFKPLGGLFVRLRPWSSPTGPPVLR